MTATTVKDVVDNLERYYDAFDGEKKSAESVLDRIDALVSRTVVVETSGTQEKLDYDGLVQDLHDKLQKGWFMESAEVKQIDKTTIEYMTRIMTDQGTMTTPRFRATIGDDYKITRIVTYNAVDENPTSSSSVVTSEEKDDDTVLRQVQAELDDAYNAKNGPEDDDVSTWDDVSAM
mmetsp:Transcript_6021/g.12082  ORF Transcript_6021/g.12082 Transcript_6021/m.12082 type:complete len:176 (-) Transcript_6021:222-749(-)|eukprot:scaffold1834_cov175-Amphora_coffeaeformis.AAC.17